MHYPAPEDIVFQNVHLDSYNRFREKTLKDIFSGYLIELNKLIPHDSNIQKFALKEIIFEPNSYQKHWKNKGISCDEDFCRRRNLTYGENVHAEIEIHYKDGGKQEQRLSDIFIGGIPLMTPGEYFVINGMDIACVMMLVPSAGVFFKSSDNGRTFACEIRALTEKKIEMKIRKQKDKGPIKLYCIQNIEKTEIKFEKENEIERKLKPYITDFPIGRQGGWQFERKLQNLDGEYVRKSDEATLTETDVRVALQYLRELAGGKDLPVDDSEHIDNLTIMATGEILESWLIRATKRKISHWKKAVENNQDGDPGFLFSLLMDLTKFDMLKYLSGVHNPARRYPTHLNELYDAAERRRVRKAPGGSLKKDENFYEPRYRDMHWSYYGRLCPVDTPQSEDVGLSLSLAATARVDDKGRVRAPCLKIEEGVICRKELDYLLASEVENLHVAYWKDAVEFERISSDEKIPTRRGSAELAGATKREISFMEYLPYQSFSIAANLVPFLLHNEPNRVLMACGAMRQALKIGGAEEPYIITGWESEVVKQSSGERGGALKLGTNALAAFMPWFGWNFEDAIVISDQLAKKLTSIHSHKHKVMISDEERKAHLKKRHDTIRKRLKRGPEYRKKLEESGEKKANNWLNVTLHREFKESDIQYAPRVNENEEITEGFIPVSVSFGMPGGNKKEQFPLRKSVLRPGVSGSVQKIEIFEDREELPPGIHCIINFTIEETKPVEIGDKISNRHGNKGIISKILPHEEMPFFIDEVSGEHEAHEKIKKKHTHVEVLLNPTGVPSRQNLGQLYEAYHCWLNMKKGQMQQTAEPLCSSLPANLAKLEDENGKEKLQYASLGLREVPVEIHDIERPVTVGHNYFMKLDANASDKFNARSTFRDEESAEESQLYYPYSPISEQPLQGRKNKGGQRLGEMEVWALLGHNAHSILREMMGPKADEKIGGRLISSFEFDKSANDFWDQCGGPESFRVLVFFLRALGLLPQFCDHDGNDQTEEMLANIDNGNACFWNTEIARVKVRIAGQEEIESWGNEIRQVDELNDDEYFGDGKRMGYIKLGTDEDPGDKLAVINPLFRPFIERIIKAIEGQKSSILEFDCTFEGSLVFRGSEHMAAFTKDFNFSKFIEWLQEQKEDIPDSYHELLRLCQEYARKYGARNLKPLLLTHIPVMPPRYRPDFVDRDEAHREGKLTNLYRDILGKIRRGTAQTEPLKFFKSINDLFKEYRNLWEKKSGIPVKILLGKRVDFSGRATISVDPRLELDECSLPRKMVSTLFRTRDQEIAEDTVTHEKFMKYPVLLNRNPTLHRMGILSFIFSIHEGEKEQNVIRINPLCTASFGADFDGDQMAVFIPLLKESIEDAERLKPSRNLFSPANGSLISNLSKDIALGIYLSCRGICNEGESLLQEEFNALGGKTMTHKELLKQLSMQNREVIVSKLDKIKGLAFDSITKCGCTYGLSDIAAIVERREKKWEDELEKQLDSNPVAWLYFSGARGDKKQTNAILGSIGRIESIQGNKVEEIANNFFMGLTPGEYFVLAYESRKSQVDRQLGTPKSGYRTKEMILAAQDITITEDDCHTRNYLTIPKDLIWDGNNMAIRMKPFNLLGRWIRKNDGEFVLKTLDDVEKFLQNSKGDISLRSPVFCKAPEGICKKCYGMDLATLDYPEIGTYAGIIAAQSIGERMTQISISSVHRGASAAHRDSGYGTEEEKEKEVDMFSFMGKRDASYIIERIKQFSRTFPEVALKHYEVILKARYHKEKDVFLSLRGAIEKQGWLAETALGKAFRVLDRLALTQEEDMLNGAINRLMIGKYERRRYLWAEELAEALK